MSTNLIGEPLAARSLTFIAIGGSGVRALEPLLFLCAFGLGPRQLKVLLIDPDQSNAAISQARTLINLYQRARSSITDGNTPNDGYFRTQVIDALPTTPVWSPITDLSGQQSGAFESRIDRAQLSGPAIDLRHVVDLLYSKQQREMDLSMGFRGVPSIGTVFMHRLRNEQFFEQMLQDAQTDGDMMFFTVGSIFGGTGAAGTPVVGRVLVDGIPAHERHNEIRGVAARRVGAALLMPYFTLPAPATRQAADGGIRPQTMLFAQNASAAMSTYTSGQAGYGSYYVIGDDQPREQQHNEVGGAAQDNAAHYVELFAAFAALDFAARDAGSTSQATPVFHATAVKHGNVTWDDLPMDLESRKRLMGGFAAMHAFLRLFRPDGNQHTDIEKAFRGATWVRMLGMRPEDFKRHSASFDHLGEFYLKAWQWMKDLRSSKPALELLNTKGDLPSHAELHETIEGRRSHGTHFPSTDDGLEVFRHWNTVSGSFRGQGYGGFLSVMQKGSESFAAERFAESTPVK